MWLPSYWKTQLGAGRETQPAPLWGGPSEDSLAWVQEILQKIVYYDGDNKNKVPCNYMMVMWHYFEATFCTCYNNPFMFDSLPFVIIKNSKAQGGKEMCLTLHSSENSSPYLCLQNWLFAFYYTYPVQRIIGSNALWFWVDSRLDFSNYSELSTPLQWSVAADCTGYKVTPVYLLGFTEFRVNYSCCPHVISFAQAPQHWHQKALWHSANLAESHHVLSVY